MSSGLTEKYWAQDRGATVGSLAAIKAGNSPERLQKIVAHTRESISYLRDLSGMVAFL
jgi:hypothetical protein